ncbi:MAG: DUF6982 domain-containing protein [Gemmatimonadales bacterium]
MSNQVVARYQDGRLVKGTSLDVDPNRPTCHVRLVAGTAVEVKLQELKALYFVRSLEGNRDHQEGTQVEAADPRTHGSVQVALRFQDGERLVGLTNRYPPNKPYFFVVPVDAKSNNVRILVNRKAVIAMEPLKGN